MDTTVGATGFRDIEGRYLSSATAPPIFFCRAASARLDYSTKSGDGLRFPPAALEDAWQELNKDGLVEADPARMKLATTIVALASVGETDPGNYPQRLMIDGCGTRNELNDDPLHGFLVGLRMMSELMADLPNGHPGCLVASYCYQDRLFDKEVRALNASAVLNWRKRFRQRLDLIAERYPKAAIIGPLISADSPARASAWHRGRSRRHAPGYACPRRRRTGNRTPSH